jgi:hypothetical protein
MERDVENMMAGCWLEFGSFLHKSFTAMKVTGSAVMMQDASRQTSA